MNEKNNHESNIWEKYFTFSEQESLLQALKVAFQLLKEPQNLSYRRKYRRSVMFLMGLDLLNTIITIY